MVLSRTGLCMNIDSKPMKTEPLTLRQALISLIYPPAPAPAPAPSAHARYTLHNKTKFK